MSLLEQMKPQLGRFDGSVTLTATALLLGKQGPEDFYSKVSIQFYFL